MNPISTTIVARQILIREGGHTIGGAVLEVNFAKKKQELQYASNRLAIRDLPDGVDEDFLELLLLSQVGLHRDEFSIEMEKRSVIITFATDRSNEGRCYGVSYMHRLYIYLEMYLTVEIKKAFNNSTAHTYIVYTLKG